MELRHLRYFSAVARLEHFGRASQILGIAQPALSRQIRQLEEEIGVDLLERLPRGVRLTAAGRAFAQDANAILSQVTVASRRARDFATGSTGRISLGFNDIASWHDEIPHRIHRFRMNHPNVAVELLPLRSAHQIRALHESELDAGIVYDVNLAGDDTEVLDWKPICRSMIRLAVPEGHRLASARRIEVVDLEPEPLVWLSRDNLQRYNNRLLAACVQSGFSPLIIQEVSTISIQLSLISAGMGLGLVGSEVSSRLPRNLVLRDVEGLVVDFQLALVWRKDNSSPALANLINVFNNAAHQQVPT